LMEFSRKIGYEHDDGILNSRIVGSDECLSLRAKEARHE
jgi:hypothetical protein